MKVILEYFWDGNNFFQSKTVNLVSDINTILDIPEIKFESKTYKPIFFNENTFDMENEKENETKYKTYFVYCKLNNANNNDKKNYKEKVIFHRKYDSIYLLPNIFRKLNVHCIKNKLPLDNYHISNNFEVDIEIINAKEEEYKMIKYILLNLLSDNGFVSVDIKNEDEIRNNLAIMTKKLNELNYIR